MQKYKRLLAPAVSLISLLWMAPASAATAVFAGGCFWCMEEAFQELDGVNSVISGFTGGTLPNPTYKGDHRGHYEAISIDYDPEVVSYATLLQQYWRNVDPFDDRGQFCDKGSSYLSAIFVSSESERQAAEATKASHEERFGREIVTPVLSAGAFYPAEDYHQDYYQKNPLRYKYYRYGCKRDRRLEQVWGG